MNKNALTAVFAVAVVAFLGMSASASASSAPTVAACGSAYGTSLVATFSCPFSFASGTDSLDPQTGNHTDATDFIQNPTQNFFGNILPLNNMYFATPTGASKIASCISQGLGKPITTTNVQYNVYTTIPEAMVVFPSGAMVPAGQMIYLYEDSYGLFCTVIQQQLTGATSTTPIVPGNPLPTSTPGTPTPVSTPGWSVYSLSSSGPAATPKSSLPTFQYLTINTSGGLSWVAWLEMELYDQNGNKISISPSQITAFPSPGYVAAGTYAVGPNGLVDGNLNTGWSAGDTNNGLAWGPTHSINGPYSGTVTINLGSPMTISRIRLAAINSPDPSAAVTTLSVSNDSKTYQTLATYVATQALQQKTDHMWMEYDPSSSISLSPPGTGTGTTGTGGTGGAGTVTGTGSTNDSTVNLNLNAAFQNFSQVLGGISAQAAAPTANGVTGGSPTTPAGTSGSNSGGACGSINAGQTISTSLQTLQGLAGVLSSGNTSPAVLSSIQGILTSMVQVITALANCGKVQ